METGCTERRSDRLKFFYILFYVCFTVCNKFIFFQYLPHWISVLIYGLLAVTGAAWIAWDFFTRRECLRIPNQTLLVLFMLTMLLSSLLNAQYGITDNLKTLVWTAIQVMLLCSWSRTTPHEVRRKQIHLVMEAVSAIWLVGVISSAVQFSVGYYRIHHLSWDDKCPQGFGEGRLFGEFTDPNVASVLSICVVLYLLYQLICHRRALAVRIYEVVNLLFQIFYIVMSGSRTAIVALMACGLVLGVFWLPRYMKAHWSVARKVLCGTGAGLVLAVAVLLSSQLLKEVYVIFPDRVGAELIQLMPERWKQYSVFFEEPQEPDSQMQEPDSQRQEPEESVSGEVVPEESKVQIDLVRPDTQTQTNISNNRFQIWTEYLQVFRDRPVFGTSPRNTNAVARELLPDNSLIVVKDYSVHNGYLSVLVGTGIVGCVLIALWIFMTLKLVLTYLVRKFRDRGGAYDSVVWQVCMLLTVAISAFFMMGIFFGNSILEVLFWLVLGYVYEQISWDMPELVKTEPLVARIFDKLLGRKETKI